jgi:mono/diheme cytochrome c family protein
VGLLRIGSKLSWGMLALALAVAPVAPSRAGETDPAPQTRAKAVLETHCTRCHQADRLQRPKPAAGLGNILRLEEIAADPHYVQPGNPDGSRLYTHLLARRMPFDVFQEGADKPAPTAAEIEAIRDWIAGLDPAQVRQCPDRGKLGLAAAQLAVEVDLASMSSVRARNVRYLSLVPLWNGCAQAEQLELARRGVAVLVNEINRRDKPVRPAGIEWRGVLLRLDLDEIGWSEAEWAKLEAAYPYAAVPSDPSADAHYPAIRADWLAYVVSEGVRQRVASAPDAAASQRDAIGALHQASAGLARLRRASQPDFRVALKSAALEPEPKREGMDMVEWLGLAYAKELGLGQAAAEIGLEPVALRAALDRPEGALSRLRVRLELGAVGRADMEAAFPAILTAVTAGLEPAKRGAILGVASPVVRTSAGASAARLELVPDRAVYDRNDLLSFTLRADVDCHLTLINVDTKGIARVLTPNDFDSNTYLPAGKEQRFPREQAPFRFRLKAAGYETIVAGCNPAGPTFDGIVHDFNLQKFTELGDYRAFLSRRAAGEAMVTPRSPAAERRLHARNRKPDKVEPAKLKPDPALRTAIRIEVK